MPPSKLQRLRQQGRVTPAAPVATPSTDWHQKFTDYLRSECHLSENTVAAYGRDLKKLLNWLGTRAITQLKLSDLSDFVASLQKNKLAASSISRAIVATRHVFQVFAAGRRHQG